MSEFEADYGPFDSMADLFRQIGHDERVHKEESLAQMRSRVSGRGPGSGCVAGVVVPVFRNEPQTCTVHAPGTTVPALFAASRIFMNDTASLCLWRLASPHPG